MTFLPIFFPARSIYLPWVYFGKHLLPASELGCWFRGCARAARAHRSACGARSGTGAAARAAANSALEAPHMPAALRRRAALVRSPPVGQGLYIVATWHGTIRIGLGIFKILSGFLDPFGCALWSSSTLDPTKLRHNAWKSFLIILQFMKACVGIELTTLQLQSWCAQHLCFRGYYLSIKRCCTYYAIVI